MEQMRIEEVDAEEGEEEDRTQWGVQWTLVGSSKPTYGNLLPPWPAPGAGYPSCPPSFTLAKRRQRN